MAAQRLSAPSDTLVIDDAPSQPATAGQPQPPAGRKRGRAQRSVGAPGNAMTSLKRFVGRPVQAWESVLRWTTPYRAAASPVIAKVKGLLAVVSGLGWSILLGAVVAGVLGNKLSWREFSFVSVTLLALFVIACLFAIGRIQLGIAFELSPQRVVVGDSAAAQIKVANKARTPVMPLGLEFPVGAQAARFTLPMLAPGASFEDMIVIPTTRRGVIEIGPVRTQRGDPFGVIRREVAWTDRYELFVHPVTVPLEPLGSGLLRDLEGRTTQDISMSDLAFHTLREYAPGDDRRYIHWRSSAKLSGVSGEDEFLVRQFLDTRRSHIAVVTDVAPASYSTPEEFEIAMSVGASIAVRALSDQMDLTIVCGEHAVVQPSPHLALDTFSRAALGEWTLPSATGRLNTLAPDASVVLLVTGPLCGFAEFQRARAFLPREAATAAIRVDSGGQVGLRETAGISVVTLSTLRELPRVMAGGQIT